MATKTGEFPERLKAILDLRGMTQSELVQVSGVSKSSISRYIGAMQDEMQDEKNAMFFEKNLLHPIDVYLITGYNIDTIKKGERNYEKVQSQQNHGKRLGQISREQKVG